MQDWRLLSKPPISLLALAMHPRVSLAGDDSQRCVIPAELVLVETGSGPARVIPAEAGIQTVGGGFRVPVLFTQPEGQVWGGCLRIRSQPP